MRKTLHLVISAVFIFCALVAQSQSRTVTGKVTSLEDGSSLPGVNVVVRGTTQGTVTDANGNYSISVDGNGTLVFSFIGLTTMEVDVSNRSTVDVQMAADIQQLNEVVVVAYGTQTKKSFTGSLATVSKESLESRPLTSFQSGMQGLAAGVQVSTSSGQPGAEPSINIRGYGSLNNSTQPLYVIDGVPVASGDYSQVATTSNVMSSINPNDIESVTVLKDASAASLYGSRAANGVVLITTKRGSDSKPKITFTLATGVNDLAVKQHDVLNASEYFKLYWDNYYDAAIAGGAAPAAAATTANASTIGILQANPYNSPNVYGAGGVLNSGVDLLYDSDWRGATLKQGRTNNYGVSINGGNKNTTYFVSGGYFDQEGIVPASDFKRYSGKISLDTKVTDFIKIGYSNTTTYSEQNTPPGAGGAANPIRFSNLMANVYSIYERDVNGDIVVGSDGNPNYNYQNPIVLDFNAIGNSYLDQYFTKTIRSLNTLYGELSFLKDFTLKSQLATDLVNVKDELYYNPEHGNGVGVNGRSQKISTQDAIFNISNTLRWGKTFGDHRVDALLGQEYWTSHYETVQATKVDFPVPGMTELTVGATPSSATSSFTDKRIISYLSRVNYSFRDRYYLSLSGRRDGSSVFGADTKWGNFWSVGASWILSEENFMANVKVLDLLKVRASYGTNGNDNIGRYAALGLISFGSNYNGSPGSSYTQLASPNLKWEVNKNMDLGVEFSLWNSKLSGEIVYFDKKSDELLYDLPLSQTTGFFNIQSNVAEMVNKGWEVTLNGILFENNDWRIGLGLNFTKLKNEILSLAGQEGFTNGTKRWKVGTDQFQYWIQEFAGVDAADGSPMWYKDVLDVNGDPTGERVTTKVYSEAVRYDQGSALPDFYGGILPSIRWKSFDLTAVLSYSSGGKIYDYTYSDVMHSGSKPGQQFSRDVLDSWTPTNTDTDVAKFVINDASNFSSQSTRFLFDGSYMRLKNVTLGYNLPTSLMSKIFSSGARVYVSGENLWTAAKHKGLDPELPASGNSNNFYPATRTIMFGLNLTF